MQEIENGEWSKKKYLKSESAYSPENETLKNEPLGIDIQTLNRYGNGGNGKHTIFNNFLEICKEVCVVWLDIYF